LALVCGALSARAQPMTAVDPARSQVQWSPRELAYLQSRGPIRMCVAPDWMPIEGIDRDGRHTGMAADFIRLMARRGGLNIQLVPAKTWEQSFALGQRRECDIFSLLMDSPSRRSFLDFTTPYLEIPGVIATSVKVPFVMSLDQLKGKRLGHMRGFAGMELLRLQHPGIQLVEVDSYEEGLTKVQDGELFGFIGNMMSIGRVLQENKIYDVKIAGRIGSDNLMSVATRNDQPMLREVFQKLVDSIRPEERQEITNRWIAVRFEQGFDYRLFWEVMGVVALVGIVTLFWATKLRRVNAELRAANERLASISRRDGEAVRRLVGQERGAARPDAAVDGVGDEDVGWWVVDVDDGRRVVGRPPFAQDLGDGVFEEPAQHGRHVIEAEARPPLLAPDDGGAGLDVLAAPKEPHEAARAGTELRVGERESAARADFDDAQRHAAERAVDRLGKVEPLEGAPLVGHGAFFTSVSQ
jgi:ABC-type amino acid transport substrate-binding protein